MCRLLRMGQQREDAVGDEIHRRDVAGDEEDEDHRQDLVLGQAIAVDLDLKELRDEVVTGGLPLSSEEIAQVGDELADVAPDLLHPLRGLRAEQVLRPAPGLLPIFGRDAEHLADDGDREGIRELRDQLHLPVRRTFAALGGDGLGGVEQVIRDLLDARPQLLDRARGERRLHQFAQARVLRWIDGEDVALQRLELRRASPASAPAAPASAPRSCRP